MITMTVAIIFVLYVAVKVTRCWSICVIYTQLNILRYDVCITNMVLKDKNLCSYEHICLVCYIL